MKPSLLKYLLLLTLTLIVYSVDAQNPFAHIYGQLKDQNTKKKLEGCMVQVYKEGAIYDTYDAGSSGKYDFKLPLGYTYDIKFSKSDYLSKIIRIDTRNIPEEDISGGFDMNVDGTLFPYREGFNTDLLKNPMAMAKYDPAGDGLQFDFDYSDRVAKQVADEFKRLDDIEKNFEKLKADFDKYVKDGDQDMMEQKYAEAVTNYKAALAIFPKEEPVKAKLADAQAKLEAENANKDAEAKYKKLVEDGDKAFKDKKYDASLKNFKDATKLKPAEKHPKEMIYQIELAMADASRRTDYDNIIADADKKFNNNDFAVSIERYKEASTMYPNEDYPKSQILKAEAALKDMLAFEAEKLRIQKEYDDKIVLAERSVSEDKLEQAISHYRAAGVLKPLEKLPKDKIEELEALIAKRKADQEASDANALANAERDRIEKEYNDYLAAADALFIEEKLEEAKLKYQDALGVKPEAQYPKSKIETIDLLLKQKEEMLTMGKAKAIQDSLDAANLAMQLALEEKLRIEEEQERLDAERRLQELEEERLAQEAKLKASKKKNWDSNVDERAEDDLEEYYRNAAEREYKAKTELIKHKKRDFEAYNSQEYAKANSQIEANVNAINVRRNTQQELVSIGKSIQEAAIADNDRKKKDTNKENNEYRQGQDVRIMENEKTIDDKKESYAAVSKTDMYRTTMISENEDKKEEAAKNQEIYQRKGDTQRTENKMAKDREKENYQQMSFDGEKVRQENEDKVESKVYEEQIRNADTRQAADQRIVNTAIVIDQKKQAAEEVGTDEGLETHKNANDIEMKKRDIEYANKQMENRSANDRFQARKDAFNKSAGEQKDEDEYLPVPGTESLKQGVTENSYELGNKKVIERTVKIGNKVDNYKKVVSKTGVYYFRNGRSITEETWRQATLSEPE